MYSHCTDHGYVRLKPVLLGPISPLARFYFGQVLLWPIFFLCVCVVWAACRPPGFRATAREPKRAHLRVPSFKNTTKIPREDPQRDKKKRHEKTPRERKKDTRRHPKREREKKAKMEAREGKKREILGLPPFGPPNLWVPTFLGLGPHPPGHPPLKKKIGLSQTWPK